MRNYIILIFSGIGFFPLAQAQRWDLKNVSIQTRWAKEVSPTNALPEYPRPQLVRPTWTNLNGLWEYAITAKDAATPTRYDGQILVPYPIESALSGVEKTLKPDQCLWYKRSIDLTPGKGSTLMHFGAVDFEATVYVNGKEAGTHSGGYTEFTFDISSLLKAGSNEVLVKVWDPSDQGYGPHGKQVLKPENIYYTPSSGIWQTVWLESVPTQYIQRLTITPNIDKKLVNITVQAATNASVTLTAAGKTVKGKANTVIALPVASPHLWSVADPYLYDLTVKLGADEVKSYFGMRKVSVEKDDQGIDRIFLNGKPYYNLGTLDQGFWPDGLYTAPTDDALKFDIQAIKAMGFNTIRKHIKIEPARWYYWTDKLGMLVWQDFVNPNQGLPEGSKAAFEKQGAEELIQLHNYPSISTWVLFNERWGQYDQERLTKWVKDSDPSRIVNGHTGELLYVNEKLRAPADNPYVGADMTDVHAYPDPMMPIKQTGKAQVLGEFGGIGVFIPNHQWLTGSAWGYIQEKPAALKAKYSIMAKHLQLLESEGLSGSIYTQPFDVEGEQNGLMTYDREVVKIPFKELREIHKGLNPDLQGPRDTREPADGFDSIESLVQNTDLTDPVVVYEKALQKYIDDHKNGAEILTSRTAPQDDVLWKLSQLAAQSGDAAGKSRFSNLYIQSLKAPFTEEQLAFIEQATNKVTDPGFGILLKELNKKGAETHSTPPDKSGSAQGDDRKKIHTKLMKIIFADVIAPYVPNPQAKPNWDEIPSKVEPYGDTGEEIFLRAKLVHSFNQGDWNNYVPAAKAYLEKYGANIPDKEKRAFQDALDQHQTK